MKKVIFTKHDTQLLCQIVDDAIKECGRKIYENSGKWDGEFGVVDQQIRKIKDIQKLSAKIDLYGEENFADWYNLEDYDSYRGID